MANFSYIQNVQPPKKIPSSNIFSIVTTVRDNIDYANAFIFTGKDCKNKDLSMGNAYFQKNGKCNNQSVLSCRNQDRYIYIDNRNKHKTTYTGILPSVIDDLIHFDINEINQYQCIARKELVGYHSPSEQNYHYETQCSPIQENSINDTKQPIESFQNYYSIPVQLQLKQKVIKPIHFIMIIISIIIIGIFFYYLKYYYR